jgi:hypothetical protein
MRRNRESYKRKTGHKNRHYSEGERRRGKPRIDDDYIEEEEKIQVKPLRKKKREQVIKEKLRELGEGDNNVSKTSSLKPPQSLRPKARPVIKAPVKRSEEEIRAIKEDISRRFREGLRGSTNSEGSDR